MPKINNEEQLLKSVEMVIAYSIEREYDDWVQNGKLSPHIYLTLRDMSDYLEQRLLDKQ